MLIGRRGRELDLLCLDADPDVVVDESEELELPPSLPSGSPPPPPPSSPPPPPPPAPPPPLGIGGGGGLGERDGPVEDGGPSLGGPAAPPITGGGRSGPSRHICRCQSRGDWRRPYGRKSSTEGEAATGGVP